VPGFEMCNSYGLCTGLEKAIARGSKFRRLYFSYR